MNLDKKLLESKLDEIALVIKQDFKMQKDVGVLDGLSGLAIFAFEYGKFKNDETFFDIGGDILTVCMDRVNKGYGLPTFCTGIAGFFWTLLHLEQHSFIALDLDEILDPMDDFLFSCMQADLEKKDYDYLHGALGYGMYFLKRYENCEVKKKGIYLDKLHVLALSVYSMAEKSNGFLRWRSKLRHDSDQTGFNLSLSHGMASIVNFFVRLASITELSDISEKIYNGASSFILSSRNNGNADSIFPSWVLSDNSQSSESRIGWCYGDFGIGVTLLQLWEKNNDQDLKVFTKSLFSNCIRRTQEITPDINDAGFCHGSFGIAYIYHLLDHVNNLDIDATSVIEKWVAKGLELACFDDGPAGFKQFHPNYGNPKYVNQLNLLEGISGIGLVLIDILSTKKGNWSESLLL